jgi:hypothetical protein
MQAVTRVLNDLVNTSAVKALQVGSEIGTDLVSGGSALTGAEFVMLVNVGVFKSQQFFFWMRQACSGQTPCTNRGTHQVYGLITSRQPMAKQKTV